MYNTVGNIAEQAACCGCGGTTGLGEGEREREGMGMRKEEGGGGRKWYSIPMVCLV